MSPFRSSIRHTLLLAGGLAALLPSPHAIAQVGFGTPAAAPAGSTFGTASRWTNGFSEAMVQLPPPTLNSTTAAADPRLAPSRPPITLGAFVQNTEAGVILTSVQPGSLAERNRLEANDIIVAVSGYQVGNVQGKVYDVLEEIQKRVDVSGRVPILIFDGKDRRLVPIVFDASAATQAVPGISGTASVASPVAVPAGSILRVELRNVSKPYQSIDRGTDLRTVAGPGPHQFVIQPNPAFIDPRDQYRLVATISNSFGQPMLEGFQDVPAPIAGRPATYALALRQSVPVTNAGFNPSQPGTTTQVGYVPDTNAITAMFQQYLGRIPDANELQAWTSFVAKGNSIEAVRAELLASRQFYDLCGNDPTLFCRQLYQAVRGKQPSQAEVSNMLARLNAFRGARLPMVTEFLAQPRT